MKKILFLILIAFNLSAFQNEAAAQLRISLGVNISSQPAWGPVGYDYVRYYYMPDIDAYYSVRNRQFIYREDNRWQYANSLPARFHYDVYNGYKVVINDRRPYMHGDVYRQRYASYRGRHEAQQVIRDSREEKYYVVKDHPMHAEYEKNHSHGENKRKHKQKHGQHN